MQHATHISVCVPEGPVAAFEEQKSRLHHIGGKGKGGYGGGGYGGGGGFVMRAVCFKMNNSPS